MTSVSLFFPLLWIQTQGLNVTSVSICFPLLWKQTQGLNGTSVSKCFPLLWIQTQGLKYWSTTRVSMRMKQRVSFSLKHVLYSFSVTVEHLVNYHQKIAGLWPPRPNRCYKRCSYLPLCQAVTLQKLNSNQHEASANPCPESSDNSK